MVERTESKGFDEFDGEVQKVEVVRSNVRDGNQYKLCIATIPATLTKSGMMYTWIGIPDTATESSVPTGSVIDAYIRALERLDSQLKKSKGHKEVFDWLVGKKFQFSKEKLGKAFGKHEAADYWVPIRQI